MHVSIAGQMDTRDPPPLAWNMPIQCACGKPIVPSDNRKKNTSSLDAFGGLCYPSLLITAVTSFSEERKESSYHHEKNSLGFPTRKGGSSALDQSLYDLGHMCHMCAQRYRDQASIQILKEAVSFFVSTGGCTLERCKAHHL